MTNVVDLPRLLVETLPEAEVPAAADLLHKVWHSTYKADLPASLRRERTPEHFLDYLQTRRTQTSIARLGGRMVGLASISANCIEDLWVVKRYRRRGIGTALVNHCLAQLRHVGFDHAQAGCEGFNRDAVQFFQSLGWTCIGASTEQLTPALHIEALVFSRPLVAA